MDRNELRAALSELAANLMRRGVTTRVYIEMIIGVVERELSLD